MSTHTWQANELSSLSRRAQTASKQICSAKSACKYSTADVIKQLKIPLKQLPNPEEARRLAHMHEWRVLVVHPDCKVEEKIQTAENLGLAPRDTSLFAAQPAGMSAQRATIMPRDARAHVDRAVLVRTEIARAIIRQDSAILFPCRSGMHETYKKCTCTQLGILTRPKLHATDALHAARTQLDLVEASQECLDTADGT